MAYLRLECYGYCYGYVIFIDNQVSWFTKKKKSFLLLMEIIVISNMLYMLDASNWNLKVEMMTETTLYEILWHYKRKVTNEKNLLVNLIVNLITKYHELF